MTEESRERETTSYTEEEKNQWGQQQGGEATSVRDRLESELICVSSTLQQSLHLRQQNAGKMPTVDQSGARHGPTTIHIAQTRKTADEILNNRK